MTASVHCHRSAGVKAGRGFPVLALLLALACVPPQETAPAGPAEPFRPEVSLRPVTVSLARGATQLFQAEINYPPGARYLRQPVAWRVLEPGGGTLTNTGLYTAPATPGTYHLQALREDFPGIAATATVVVR